MNIIFLDIDGVLNSLPYFESMKKCDNKIHNEIDESRLPYLQRIVKENNAHIVLSSTWRDLNGNQNEECFAMWKYLVTTLAKYDLQIISQTPIIEQIRPLEIKAWLKGRSDRNDIKWISLDDDWDEEHYGYYGIGGHLVRTKFFAYDINDGGLQEEHVALAKRLFEKQY